MRSILVSLLVMSVGCAPGEFSSPGNDPPDNGPDAGSPPPPPPPPPDQPDAAPPDAVVGRAIEDLQALYEFNEGLGPMIHDTSNIGTPADLEVEQPGLTTWTPNGLRIDASTIIRLNAPAIKIIEACRLSNEITLEAWLTPATTNTGGVQTRIAGVSLDTDNRNFSLFQNNADYQIALRTGATNLDGDPPIVVTAAVTTTPQHIVYTRDALGQARVYLNGAEVAQGIVGDTFANWDLAYEMLLVNEGTLNRPWLGTVHLVAVYSRALTLDEVLRNYNESY